ncbi:hypothetical protein B0T19DRAFT_471367 [Cercophora scortea]|uniref:Sm domain-containing protein n=1 Tax=Cercophora scortea TaxID=314031 RepID=A0AAE0MM86_9PEZI|nr:hypothetical protein B0T19DRAFT_471367 [Cercophora scortea]
MLFFSFFKTLIDHEVTVELKNDIQIRGTLKSVDQYLNIKLEDISVVEELKYPHLSAVKNVFIRGSVVRYVHLPASAVDIPLLEDATRRGESCHVLSCSFISPRHWPSTDTPSRSGKPSRQGKVRRSWNFRGAFFLFFSSSFFGPGETKNSIDWYRMVWHMYVDFR